MVSREPAEALSQKQVWLGRLWPFVAGFLLATLNIIGLARAGNASISREVFSASFVLGEVQKHRATVERTVAKLQESGIAGASWSPEKPNLIRLQEINNFVGRSGRWVIHLTLDENRRVLFSQMTFEESR